MSLVVSFFVLRMVVALDYRKLVFFYSVEDLIHLLSLWTARAIIFIGMYVLKANR